MIGDQPRRLRLLAIVGQAWLLGAIGGTAIDLLALNVLVGLPDGLAGTAFAALKSVAAASLLPCGIGVGLVMIAPAFSVRRCGWLGAAMVISVTGLATALFGIVEPPSRIIVALVFLDAALAASWCWHQTKGLDARRPAELAAIFE